jgi:small subunit ribosomal protein S6
MIMARSYETIIITRPDYEPESIEKLHERLLKAIDDAGGVELKLADWGRRKLAYPISGQRKGNYYYWGFIASPDCLSEVHRHLKLSADVLRFQTITLSEALPFGQFDIALEKERVEALTPDPQDDEEPIRRERRDRRRRRDEDDDDDDDNDHDEEDDE